jgi:hypothetical protein
MARGRSPTADDPAQEEALTHLVEDQMIPAFKRLLGFVRYCCGVDRSAQRAVAVTVWDDMEHAAGLRSALGGFIQQLEAIGVRFEPAQLYEITTQA